MKVHHDGLDAYVRAFKDATDESIDMRATRARVLAAVAQRAHRRSSASRVLPIAIAGLVIGSSASAGVMSLAGHWRAPPAVTITAERPAPRPGHAAARPAVVIPAATPALAPADSPGPDAAERAAYARAHVAHFDGTSWLRALAAWDDYLRATRAAHLRPKAATTGPSASSVWNVSRRPRRRCARSPRAPSGAVIAPARREPCWTGWIVRADHDSRASGIWRVLRFDRRRWTSTSLNSWF